MSNAGAFLISGGGPGVVDTLTGNTGGAVSPDGANNINILGTGSISVSGNPGTHTLTIQDTGLTGWNKISTSQALVVNMGYFCTGGGTLSLSLPAASVVGDQISVSLAGATGWIITQGASQEIFIGSSSTTVGATGTLASNTAGDTITMVCLTTNLVWVVISAIGNPSVV